MFFGWGWADPLASVIVAVLVFRSGYLATKSSVHVLMEGTPDNDEIEKVTEKNQKTKGIKSIHDLHVWTITSGLNTLTCHAVVDDKMTIGESEMKLRKIEHDLEHLRINTMNRFYVM